MSRLDALIAILEILEEMSPYDRVAVVTVLEKLQMRGTLATILDDSREQGAP